MPKISVIIPVYNTEKYLPECLDSVLDQSFRDFEIICVNDGSPDNSAQILQEYAQKNNCIKIITQTNQGLSEARNVGLDKASGEYILFLDSDDSLPEYALEVMMKIAQDSNVPVVVSELSKRDFKSTPFNYQVFRSPLSDFVNNNRIHSNACSKFYRSDVLKTHRFIKGIYFEDWPFLTMLFGEIDSFAVTKIPCYRYRREGVSIIRSPFSQKKVDSYLTGIRCVYDFYQNRPDLSVAQKRMNIAVKMMVNKVYKTKDKELIHYTLSQLGILFQKKIIHKYSLSFKTLFRLWKMSHMK